MISAMDLPRFRREPLHVPLPDGPRAFPDIAKWAVPELRVVRHEDGSARLELQRARRSGSVAIEKKVRLGPNSVYAAIIHRDGTVTHLGESPNLLTNIGRDWWADNFGAKAVNGSGQGSPLTAVGATSATATGTPWTASNLATPQLGLAGKVIVVPITNLTTTPVFGLVVSNTTSVATLDKWWTPDFAGTGTTPASTSAFIILPGTGPGAFFMALTTSATAASATDTSLPSEITTNGGARSKCTYAHTYGNSTSTHQVVFSITGTLTAIHKMGLLPTSAVGGADPCIFESVLNQDATVGNGDTLTVTDTITYSG